jgi:hypothetical protein
MLQLDFLGAIGANGIFNQLKYAPVLQQLCLRLVYISFSDLEIIHQNISSLKTLILEWVRVFHGDGSPSNIIPATCLTSLHFTVIDVANLNTHVEFYQYINQKYTNLIHVEHKDAKIYDYNRHDLKVLYYNGYLDFLKSVGRIQNRWYLNESRDDVDALDLDGDDLEYFRFIGMRTAELFRDLVRYNHVQDIRELTLSNAKANTFEVLKHMPALTTLKLHFNGPNDPPLIDLTPYFNACPDSVTSFDIDCFQVVFDPYRIRACSIENLSITSSEMIPQCFALVEECLPSLLGLKLVGSVADEASLVFHREDPLEQAAFILDASSPVGFIYKGLDKSYNYYCNDDDIRLATWHDIQGLPMINILSFLSRRVVVDD